MTLSITATSIPSLDWVGKLSHLTGLALNNERLESLDLAATLVSLTSLQATGNPRVKSVAPLAKLEHPTLLQLEGTQIEDLAPLAGMTKLSALTISRTRVKSPAPLAKITTLKMVQATDTTVTDLKPLLASTGLTFLAPPKLCPDAEVEAVKKAAPNVHISR